MGAFVARRLFASLPVLLGLSVAVFTIIQLPPGGPVDFYASQGSNLSREEREAIERQLGLDQPAPIQYLKWLTAVLRGDWGRSYQDSRKVTAVVSERLPASLQLMGASLFIAVVAALPLGIFGATRGHVFWRNVLEVVSILCISVPSFWLGLIGILIFSLWLNILPTGGMYTIGVPRTLLDSLHHLIMPALVASLYWVGAWSRYVRGSMLEVIRQDYVRTARAKGLTERTVLWRHTLRNALIPFITVVGLRLPSLLSGAVVVEIVFSWPGIGQLLHHSMLSRDYPVLMGCFMGVAVLVIMGNLMADVLYAVVDPRIRY
jgi:peptide/nickel transport system permease protein